MLFYFVIFLMGYSEIWVPFLRLNEKNPGREKEFFA
jgi:hypothetical protein